MGLGGAMEVALHRPQRRSALLRGRHRLEPVDETGIGHRDDRGEMVNHVAMGVGERDDGVVPTVNR